MKNFRKQQGSSLLEAMISLFVLGVGVLGVLALQTKSLRFNQQAYIYSQAVFLANELVEHIRINSDHAALYVKEESSSHTGSSDCIGAGSACTPTQIKDWNLSSWYTSMSERLPNGKAAIDYDGDNVTITISFDGLERIEKLEGGSESSAAERQNYILTTAI